MEARRTQIAVVRSRVRRGMLLGAAEARKRRAKIRDPRQRPV